MCKKYVLVIDQIRTGGAEKILLDYYYYLKQKNKEVSIFVLQKNEVESSWVSNISVVYGINYNRNNIFLKLFYFFYLIIKFNLFLYKYKPDVTFSFLEKSNILNHFSFMKVKKIMTIHNVLSIQYEKLKNKFIKNFYYNLLKNIYNSNKNIIAVSNSVKDDLVSVFSINQNNIHVVNNRIDVEQVRKLASENVDEFSFNPLSKYIINVGRLTLQKSQSRLIKAFNYLINENPDLDVHLIIIGEGEDEEYLKNLAIEIDCGRIHFLPFMPNPYKFIKKSNLFALSSKYEGFPIVIAECSALRIPFVGTTYAIPKEIYDDHNIWHDATVSFYDSENKSIVELSNLLFKGLNNENFIKSILDSTSAWEGHNSKTNQFIEYDKIVAGID